MDINDDIYIYIYDAKVFFVNFVVLEELKETRNSRNFFFIIKIIIIKKY